MHVSWLKNSGDLPVLHCRVRNGSIIHYTRYREDDSFKNKTNSNAKEKNVSNFFSEFEFYWK